MKIIPAVDIMGGKCVQLVGGKPGTEKIYGDPVDIAREWVSMGAEILHVVDLDAALGTGNNTEIVQKIVEIANVPVQFGGGIRSVEQADLMLESEIERIIIGTLAIRDYFNEFKNLKTLNERFGHKRLIAAIDSKEGNIVIKGWQEKSELVAADYMKESEKYVWGFLYTDVDVEGRMQGINTEPLEEVVGATDKPVIISGGISSNQDIKRLGDIGAWGAVIGKALYEGRITLKR